MVERDGAGSLIPLVVRGAALLMCWGSHIVAEILSLSRHVLCARQYVCVSAHAALVCCGRTSPAGVLPVNTSISQAAQSVTMLSLLHWPHGKDVLTHTSLPIYGRRWLCVCVTGFVSYWGSSWVSLSFLSLLGCDLALSVCIMKLEVSRSSSPCVCVLGWWIPDIEGWPFCSELCLMNSLDGLLSRQNTSPLDTNTAARDQYIHVKLYCVHPPVH